jgi:hypothetical protein
LISRRFIADSLPSSSSSLAFSSRSSASSFSILIGETECRDQRRLRFVRLANDADDFVDIQKDDHPAFEDVNPVVHLAQTVARAARDRRLAEHDPFVEHVAQALLTWPTIAADHHEIERCVRFEAGMREQRVDEFGLIDAARFRLEYKSHRRITARFVAHGVEQREHRLLRLELIGRERLLA